MSGAVGAAALFAVSVGVVGTGSTATVGGGGGTGAGGEGATCGLGDIYVTRRNPAHGWSEPEHLACAPDGPNSPENTRRSWDMVARYVVPEINGYLAGLRQSREFVVNNRTYFNRAREAVMANITAHEAAAAALGVTKSPLVAASSSNVPDLDAARTGLGAG